MASIFTKIILGEIPSYKIYEDENGLINIQSNPLSILTPGILQRIF